MSQLRRSGALLVSVYLDADDGQAWYGRVLSYRDSLNPEGTLSVQTTVDGLCELVRRWLEEMTDGQVSSTARR